MVKLSLKQKPVHLLIIVTLAFLISVPMVLPRQAAAQTDGYYHKSFAWDYNGKHWTWNLTIPQSLYDAYREVPVSTRTRDGPAGYGFLTTTQDYYVKTLAQKLNETATQQGYNSYDQVSFVLAFVQSLPYTSDNVTEGYNEYPRFPIETLVDDGGDCEDTSILFASLTLEMGYGTVYINPPDHYAVGILGNKIGRAHV
jgi:transglutaminase-like putative cysteine protease